MSTHFFQYPAACLWSIDHRQSFVAMKIWSNFFVHFQLSILNKKPVHKKVEPGLHSHKQTWSCARANLYTHTLCRQDHHKFHPNSLSVPHTTIMQAKRSLTCPSTPSLEALTSLAFHPLLSPCSLLPLLSPSLQAHTFQVARNTALEGLSIYGWNIKLEIHALTGAHVYFNGWWELCGEGKN